MWAEFAKKYDFQKTAEQCRVRHFMICIKVQNHYQAMVKKYKKRMSQKDEFSVCCISKGAQSRFLQSSIAQLVRAHGC